MFAALANMHVPQAVSRPEKPLVALDVRAQQDKLSRSFALSAEHGFLARFVVLNLIGAALVAAAWAEDLLAKPYQADTSGMCWLITALFGWGLQAGRHRHLYRRRHRALHQSPGLHRLSLARHQRASPGAPGGLSHVAGNECFVP